MLIRLSKFFGSGDMAQVQKKFVHPFDLKDTIRGPRKLKDTKKTSKEDTTIQKKLKIGFRIAQIKCEAME